ncbi:phosphodiester glycosidase family protein [Kitasatospora sp. NPDC056138]|uniref:phosphodiester glycosidase family protein n=1 Tax=Kitasatospora sp. NPDC056138 TaxID=3345724 RepID=UPI0035D83F07
MRPATYAAAAFLLVCLSTSIDPWPESPTSTSDPAAPQATDATPAPLGPPVPVSVPVAAAPAASAASAAKPAAPAVEPYVAPDEGRFGSPEQVVPGVEYRSFTVPTSHGSAHVHLLTADLNHPGVRAGMLYPGAVASTAPVSGMASEQGAVGGINGDFFDISEEQHPGVEATGATSGPMVLDGRPLKGAVPQGQRFGWTPPDGDTSEDVFGVGTDGRARTARLTLRGHVRTPKGLLELGGLNQYALPVDSIGVFTPRWGSVSRARAVCGTDDDRAAPCTGESYEVTVRQGKVESVSESPGRGAIPEDAVVLLGREAGARALRELTPGTPVQVDYALESTAGVPFAFALGAYPVVRGHEPLPGLDTAVAEPRTAVGITAGGRVLHLLSMDGREGTSSGLTVGELADVLRSLGCTEAVYLDGGGSATLATRDPGTGMVRVRNNLDRGQERSVPNGIAVFSG